MLIMTHKRSNVVSLGRVPSSNAFQFRLFNCVLDDRPKKLAQLLAEAEGDVNIDACNTRGQTALFASCLSGRLKCSLALLKHGADANRRSDDGSTAVHAAAFSCSSTLLQAVIECGGDLRLHDYQGLLPRDWAEEAGAKYNRKVLDLIDRFYEESVKKLSSQSSFCKPRQSTATLSKNIRSIHSNEMAVVGRCSKKCEIHHNGFGDFVSIPLPGTFASPMKQCEIGFLSVMPVIKVNQIVPSFCEPTKHFQSPPCFTLSSGCWGSQAVTLKKENKLKRKKQTFNFSDLMIRELNILRVLHHPHILSLLGVSMEDCDVIDEVEKPANNLVPQCFVFEHVAIGSLHCFLHIKQHRLSVANSLALLIQVLDALSFINFRGFVHRCLTSYAVQLVNINTAKITDFYYSLHSEDVSRSHLEPHVSFNRWLAPEILAEKQASFECDVYSFCVVATEMISGILPWRNCDVNSIRYQIVSKGRTLPIPTSVPAAISSVLSQGLVLSRQKRVIKLKQIQSAIKYFIKCGNCLNESKQRTLIADPSLKATNQVEEQALDVPDAARFVVSVDDDHSIVDTVFNKRPISSSSRRCSASVEPHSSNSLHHISSQTTEEKKCLKPSSCFLKEDFYDEINPLCNRKGKAKGRFEAIEDDGKNEISFDDDCGCVHPDLLSVDTSSHASLSSDIGPSECFETSSKTLFARSSKRFDQTELDAPASFSDQNVEEEKEKDVFKAGRSDSLRSRGQVRDDNDLSQVVGSEVAHAEHVTPNISSELPESSNALANASNEDLNQADSSEILSITSSLSDEFPCSVSDIDKPDAEKEIHLFQDSMESMGGKSDKLQDERVTSPVMDEVSMSLRSVNQSLAKLSAVLTNKPAFFSLESDCPIEGCADAKPTQPTQTIPSTPWNCAASEWKQPSNQVAPITPCSSSSFVGEVISAIGDKRLMKFFNSNKNRKEGSAKSHDDKVYTNVKEWDEALRRVPDQQSSSGLCKLGAMKRRQMQRHVSLQEGSLRGFDLSAAESSLKRRHSSACDEISVLFSSIKDEDYCDDVDGAELLESASGVPLCEVIQPSAFHDLQCHLTDCSSDDANRLQLPQETKKRPNSITSADLLEIFSEFADRSNRASHDDDVRADGDSFTSSSLSDRQSVADWLSSQNVTNVDSAAQVLMVSRSCQTEISKEKLIKSAICLKPPAKIASKQAISPPVVDEFLQRTGDWAELLEKQNASEKPPTTEGSTLTVSTNTRTRSAPNIHLQFYSSPKLSRDSAGRRPCRPILPASHLHAMETNYCAPAVDVMVTPPPVVGESESLESTNICHLTPSKLSFQNKLSLFESHASASTNCSSPSSEAIKLEVAPKSDVCHELNFRNADAEKKNNSCIAAINKETDVSTSANLPSSEVAVQQAVVVASSADASVSETLFLTPEKRHGASLPVECPPSDGLVNVKATSRLTRALSDATPANAKKLAEVRGSTSLHSTPCSNENLDDGIRLLTKDLVDGTLRELTSLSASDSNPQNDPDDDQNILVETSNSRKGETSVGLDFEVSSTDSECDKT